MKYSVHFLHFFVFMLDFGCKLRNLQIKLTKNCVEKEVFISFAPR
jgi:hypothetical protein